MLTSFDREKHEIERAGGINEITPDKTVELG
jgi:hypothetical protein